MAGEEVLVADGNAGDRAEISATLERRELVPSAVDNAALARDRIAGKFFAVAFIDLDLPGGGLELLEFVRDRSRGTQVVMLTSRKNFEGAVQSFRHGCVDVVSKQDAPALDRAMEIALERYRANAGEETEDEMRVLDDLMKTIVALGRQVYASEIDSLTEIARTQIHVLFVDDDTRFLKDVSALVMNVPMEASVEMSCGGAMDKIGEHHFDVVICNAALQDLPGSIAVEAAQQRNPECVGLLYTTPGASGHIDRVMAGRTMDTYTPFKAPEHLAERVRQIVDEEHARRRERKVLQVIGSKHSELLRRYAEAKRKLGERVSIAR